MQPDRPAPYRVPQPFKFSLKIILGIRTYLKYPVHPNSAQFIASIGANTKVHADFGTVWEGAPIGIPYTIVGGDQPKVNVTFIRRFSAR
jgi:hypothetical protein